MKKPHLILSLFIPVFLMLSGCSGCSESALQHRAAQQQSSQNQNYGDSSVQNDRPNPIQSSRVQNPVLSEGRTLIELFEQNKAAVFMVFTSDDEHMYQGSGFFISNDGMAVSNYHIFEGTLKGNEMILTESGNEYKISRVIEQNKELDYIIFKVSGYSNFHTLQIASLIPEIGQDVFAIGNPRGLSHSLSTGIISSFRDEGRLLQTTAEITHGSSGGALLNMNGEVVGITTGGIGEANINFAVNIQRLRLHRFLD